jgi:hypothetical protein
MDKQAVGRTPLKYQIGDQLDGIDAGADHYTVGRMLVGVIKPNICASRSFDTQSGAAQLPSDARG